MILTSEISAGERGSKGCMVVVIAKNRQSSTIKLEDKFTKSENS
jgi:hypothetical protein